MGIVSSLGLQSPLSQAPSCSPRATLQRIAVSTSRQSQTRWLQTFAWPLRCLVIATTEDGQSVLLAPLAYETYGRWGKLAAVEFRRLARARVTLLDAATSADASAVFRGALLRWRRELSVCLQLGNAQVMSHCVVLNHKRLRNYSRTRFACFALPGSFYVSSQSARTDPESIQDRSRIAPGSIQDRSRTPESHPLL